MIEIKKYLFHDLTEKELEDLTQIYNKIRLETTTWLDKGSVSVAEFSDLVDVETIYIAYEHDKMMGFLTYYVPDDFIHLFFIDAKSQGSGIGSLLLAELISDFEGEKISLKCLIHNHSAISFYEAKGFKIIETHEGVDNTGYHLMRR